MKKVLFATTALVATASVASADIAFSGVAQMGIQGGESSDVDGTGVDAFGAEQETQFVQDIDITFTMSGTSDNGLTFGAAVDLDENAGGVGTDDAGVAIFVSGDFGTLTLGDTDGALDWAMQEVALGGASINDNETTHAGYRGAYLDGSEDGQILRYDYSFGGFGVAFSVEQDDDASNAVTVSPFAVGNVAGVPLATPNVAITSTGAPTFYTPLGINNNFGAFATLVPGATFSDGLYDIEALDFDLDSNPLTGDANGNEMVDGNLGTLFGENYGFTNGVWDGNGAFATGGGGTYIDVLETLMALEAFSTGNAWNPISGGYTIANNPAASGGGNLNNVAGDVTADALAYVDESDFDYAIGLSYTFDTGMGDLTVGGGWQQGGTIYASQLIGTTAAGSAAVATGTDLTVAPAAPTALSEAIISGEQIEYGVSASYVMTNGFSAGFQYTHIENAAAMGYTIGVDSTAAGGTSATVTNAMFTDATHYGIGAAYTFDAITVAANYGMLDYDNASFADASGYGLVGQYDFGGGLSAHLGYGYSEVGSADASNWSFGLSMSF
jgi:hypothetical protein